MPYKIQQKNVAYTLKKTYARNFGKTRKSIFLLKPIILSNLHEI